MLIDSDHRASLTAGVATAAAATAGYLYYAAQAPNGPSGGSAAGIAFGVIGTVFMIVPGLLGVRKRVRVRRIGSARVWMMIHIWLGLLSVVFVWLHSGFSLGGPLTTALMVLFYAVTASGVFGVVVQHFVPRMMTSRVPLETIQGQIDYVLEGLAADAYEIVAGVAGTIPEAVEEQKRIADEEVLQKARPGDWKQIARQRPAEAPAPGARALREFYLGAVRPYLHARAATAAPDFQPLRAQAPEAWQGKVERLAQICDEARQLAAQRRLHAVLHNWLFLHAPVSLAMFVLAAFHIFHALRY